MCAPINAVVLGGFAFPDPTIGEDPNGGRISACSYRSYLSYDELAPETSLDDRLSLVSGRTSTTPGPDVALVTPNGTLYRLSDRSVHHHRGTPSKTRDTGCIVKEGPDPCSLLPEVNSADLDDVFLEEDSVMDVSDEERKCTSVSDFAVARLRRQHPDRIAVVGKRHTFNIKSYLRRDGLCI